MSAPPVSVSASPTAVPAAASVVVPAAVPSITTPASAKPAAAASAQPVTLKPETKKETAKVPPSSPVRPMPQATVQLKQQAPSQSASVSGALKIQPVTPLKAQDTLSPVLGGIAVAAGLIALLVQIWMML